MKKIFISFAMMCMAMGGYAATEDDGTYVGWPANYGGVMLQGFWWDSYDATQWTELTSRASELAPLFDLIWIPNAGTTSTGKYAIEHGQTIPNTMGYDPCYWLEYESCFGTEAELKDMIAAYKNYQGFDGFIEDVVINHKNGVTGWCDFPQESVTTDNGTYTLTWDNDTYSEICCTDECNWAGYKTSGAEDTGTDFGAYRDLDHTNSQVQANVKTYLNYLLKEMGFVGFRYDMVLGYGASYINTYNNDAKPRFSVGEYWSDLTSTQNWISNTAYASAAFDFPLKYKLNTAISGGDYSALDWKSFTFDPNFSQYSVTFADNHDTGRNDDMLKYNWSAANAFILASPGTPCVWFKHYEADPTNIAAMIQARKACGITNTGCNVLQQSVTNNGGGYILETQGTNGKVYVQFGNAVGDTPSGYTLVASGDSYKFYSTSSVSNVVPVITISSTGSDFYTETLDVTLTPNSAVENAWYSIDNNPQVSFNTTTTVRLGEGVNYGSTITLSWGSNDGAVSGSASFTKLQATTESVYLNNIAGWDNVYCYAWSGDHEVLGSWPGTVVTTINNDGNYQQDFTGDYPANIIWNAGSNVSQTADLYYVAGKVYTNGATESGTVLLNNTAYWENVYCYAWNGEGPLLGNWPGTQITTTNDNGYYVAEISGTPTGIIWNDGNGVQTDDLSYVDGQTYDNGKNIFFEDYLGWDNVYCYAWSGTEEENNIKDFLGSWPGALITKKDVNGNYYAILDKDATPQYVIWNNNSGTQTDTYDYEDNGWYTNIANFKSVCIAGSFNEWKLEDVTPNADFSGTYTLDLSETTEDVEFKLVVDGTYLGYNQVTIDAPNGWIPQVLDGNNITLKNSETGYQTYLITATWTPNASATSGWTVKIEGVDVRAVNTIYYDNSSSNWTNVYYYAYDGNGNAIESWPGNQLSANSAGLYEVTLAARYTTVIFNNGNSGSGNQTADLTVVDGKIYSLSAGANTQSGYTVYFEKPSSWSNVYFHAWITNGATYNSWPGEVITETNSDGYYMVHVDDASYSNIIFNNGNSGSGNQTADLTAVDGRLYTLNDGLTTNLVLTEGYNYYNSSEFTAATAKYSRTTSNQWGTIIMPFDITSDNDVQYYELSSIGSGVMTFEEVSTVSAGHPAVFYLTDASTGLNISLSNVTVIATADDNKWGTEVSPWYINGTFKATTKASTSSNYIYYIANNAFWCSKYDETTSSYKSITASPFRAWFEYAGSSPASARFRIADGEDETEGIESIQQDVKMDGQIYDLYGRKLAKPKKGFNVINGMKIIIK